MTVDSDERYRAWRQFQIGAGGGPDLPTDMDEGTPEPAVVLEGYSVVRHGRYWKLTYPDGQWQRTTTKRAGHRVAALHFIDRAAWTIAVKGDGAVTA